MDESNRRSAAGAEPHAAAQPALDLDDQLRVVGANEAATALLGDGWRGMSVAEVLRVGTGRWSLSRGDTTASGHGIRMTLDPAETARLTAEVLALASRGILAREIAHDINNLLTCVLATASLPSPEREDLAAIAEATTSAAVIP